MSKKSVITVGLVCGVIFVSGLVARADVIGYWRFEDDPGFVTDSSVNGFTLTKGDGSTPSTYPTPYTLPPASGQPGEYFDNPIPQNGLANAQAASFDASTYQYFGCTDKTAFAVGDFTIEAYIHREYSGDREVIAAQYADVSGYEDQRSWALVVESTGSLALWLSNSGKSGTIYSSGLYIPTDHDYFVAASYNQSEVSAERLLNFYVKDLDTGFWSVSTKSHGIARCTTQGRISISVRIPTATPPMDAFGTA